MRLPASIALFAPALLLSIACGGAPTAPDAPAGEPAQSAAPDTDGPVDGAAPSPAGADASGPTGAAAPPEPPPAPAGPPPRERVRIHSSCQKQMKLRIERNNDSDTNTSINQNSSQEERGKDGDEIQLLAENNAVLHTIKIEEWMKEVDVVRDCNKLEGKR